MKYFGKFYLDKEKDMIVSLYRDRDELFYVIETPNHKTGNLITNLASICGLPLTCDKNGMKIIKGEVPCYIDAYNRKIYIFRLNDTKVANIFEDGRVEMKASVPAISKTLMSQTKDYHLDFKKTVVKTFILNEYKFHSDLHTHMNANLAPDILIALGIHHQIRYPLYYIKKLGLKCSEAQQKRLEEMRKITAGQFSESRLTGKYLTRKIDDNTFINFADLILNDPEDAAWNIPRIRASLAVMKDGQAVFTNLEKVYLYRYVFAKGKPADYRIEAVNADQIPDEEIRNALKQMMLDRENPSYRNNTLFQDKLLWIARGYQKSGIAYAEISDTTLVKKHEAAHMLKQVHDVMPAVTEETGVVLRFLAAVRRIPLTIVKDEINSDYVKENLQVLRAVACDPYVAGSDIVGEEINDILDLKPMIREIVKIAADDPSFTIRIHAGENDSLRDNVDNSIRCVKESLQEGQTMPKVRIGHGLYTANLKTKKGRQLISDILGNHVVLEFQITSNVRLNNLSSLKIHPLKQYLDAGISCVQGTDGGALYGTDSIDEQLCLEKMLDLSRDDLLKMRHTEDAIISESMEAFKRKKQAFEKMCSGNDAESFLQKRIEEAHQAITMPVPQKKYDSLQVLHDRIGQMPVDRIPVIIAGGSFNSDRHITRMHGEECRLIDFLLENLDPGKVFFVTGHRLCGYEKYLIDNNKGRFDIYSFVPSALTAAQKRKLADADLKFRVAIEPSGMGVYKSVAYEIFKRRQSVLIAFDGNSACANMIQDAKNAKYNSVIYISEHSRILKEKAGTIRGYVTLFSSTEQLKKEIPGVTEKLYEKMSGL